MIVRHQLAGELSWVQAQVFSSESQNGNESMNHVLKLAIVHFLKQSDQLDHRLYQKESPQDTMLSAELCFINLRRKKMNIKISLNSCDQNRIYSTTHNLCDKSIKPTPSNQCNASCTAAAPHRSDVTR